MLSSSDDVCSVRPVGFAGATGRGSDSTMMSKSTSFSERDDMSLLKQKVYSPASGRGRGQLAHWQELGGRRRATPSRTRTVTRLREQRVSTSLEAQREAQGSRTDLQCAP